MEEDLKSKLKELKSKQFGLETTISKLKREKKELESSSPLTLTKEQEPPQEIASQYSYIYPLVEEIYFLELKEKELKERYHDKQLAVEARLFGQQLLSASFTKEETVLKPWYEELREIRNSDPPLSMMSADSQDTPTVHNIVYNCHHDSQTLVEDLAWTVLCQAVHARLNIHSELPCSHIHFNSSTKADIKFNCDNYIPGLEEMVLQLLEHNTSVKGIILKMGDYISSDMAPFVISIPMKKKGRKKKKETLKGDSSNTAQDVGVKT